MRDLVLLGVIAQDAIINETTIFDKSDPHMVLVRGYPGPVGVPFYHLETPLPGANPKGPNKTLTVPTWPTGVHGPGEAAVVTPAGALMPAQQLQDDGPKTKPESCGAIVPGFFYYSWGRNRPNNSLPAQNVNSTADCCEAW